MLKPERIGRFSRFLWSQGIAVECLIEVHELRLYSSQFSAVRFDSVNALSAAIQTRIKPNQSLQGNLLIPELAALFIERCVAIPTTVQSLEMMAMTETYPNKDRHSSHMEALQIGCNHQIS